MKLEIQKMLISNFKGTKEREVVFSGDVTHIAGANGTGKTTIQDAFCWVLFNQDSRGNAPGSDHFREKPLGEDGQEIHNLDTTVELLCRLDGKPFNLKRTQRESWVKKRGSVEATYTGNASTYWINDVETPLKDFKKRIAEIVPEDVFRLIGSLSAFNALDWKKRRQQLMAMIDHNVDEALMTKAEYTALSDSCEDRNLSVDDLRKVLADQKRRANDELKLIPARIDEVRMTISDIKPADVLEAKTKLDELEGRIAALDAEMVALQQESGVELLATKLNARKASCDALKSTVITQWQTRKDILVSRKAEADRTMKNGLQDFKTLQESVTRVETQLASGQVLLDKLRARYMEIKSKQFASAHNAQDRHCPTCGQALPEGQVQDAIREARQIFESDKQAALSQMMAQGKEQADVVAQVEKDLADLKQRLGERQRACNEDAVKAQEAAELLAAHSDKPVFDSLEIQAMEAEIAELVDQLTSAQEIDTTQLEAQKAELKDQVRQYQEMILLADRNKAAKKRVEELEKQQKDQGIKIAELENLIALSEDYVTERCRALSESVNEKFDTISWKLFDTQVNGGIVDTCVCMIPCDSGLVAYESANTASQINADLEIVNALSRHYGVSVPLFVDNSERVNKLSHTDSQMITLAVSDEKELTVK